MSCPFPPEILDHIVDHLHDEPAALRTCCTVSKSWVPRTRKHLFTRIEFNASKSHMKLWKKTFSDPEDSPAHHTRSLFVCGIPMANVVEEGVGGWIRTFCNVVCLEFSHLDQASLVPFYGLSPAVSSLRLDYATAEVFDLICSFPLLEDLTLVALSPEGDADGWNAPLMSPKLTGTLSLWMFGRTCFIVRRLLDLPGGVHFSKIDAMFSDHEAKSVTDLVSKCSDTLEKFSIIYYPLSAFPSVPVAGRYLTSAHRRRFVWGTFP